MTCNCNLNGGMALTAEQVEDVEALVATANPYSAPADRLRALFPATEPAEEEKPCGSNSVTLGWCKLTARHEGLHTNGTYLWGTPSEPDPPAPAVPAEEETKADPRMDEADLALAETRAEVACAVAKYPPFNSSHEGYAVLKEEVDELWDDVKANNVEHSIEEAVQVAAMAIRYITDMRASSSPVVPAPTETGPWDTWQEVPRGQTVRAANGERFRKNSVGAIHLLANGDGDCCQIDGSTAKTLPASFVADEEG